YEKIQRQKISAEERIRFIQGLFAQGGTTTLPFHRLVMDEGDRYDVALSFSSVLELVKQKQVMAQQRRLFGEILVSKREELGDDHEE
ncbi:MAG: hypothetical protein RR626_02340, partial [Anaerovoracaceae bacterium]